MLSLLTQSNRLKYFLVDCLGLHIYIYVINVLYKIQLAITYTGIHYNGYLWSSPLSQHRRAWTSHVGLHEQCMAKFYIFPRSLSTLGKGGCAWAHAYLGNANCWFTVDIICQHLAESASKSRVSCTVSNWSSDNALAPPMTDSSRLERGVVAD